METYRINCHHALYDEPIIWEGTLRYLKMVFKEVLEDSRFRSQWIRTLDVPKALTASAGIEDLVSTLNIASINLQLGSTYELITDVVEENIPKQLEFDF